MNPWVAAIIVAGVAFAAMSAGSTPDTDMTPNRRGGKRVWRAGGGGPRREDSYLFDFKNTNKSQGKKAQSWMRKHGLPVTEHGAFVGGDGEDWGTGGKGNIPKMKRLFAQAKRDFAKDIKDGMGLSLFIMPKGSGEPVRLSAGNWRSGKGKRGRRRGRR